MRPDETSADHHAEREDDVRGSPTVTVKLSCGLAGRAKERVAAARKIDAFVTKGLGGAKNLRIIHRCCAHDIRIFYLVIPFVTCQESRLPPESEQHAAPSCRLLPR